MTSDDDLMAQIEAKRNDPEFMGRIRRLIEREGIPVGTDDPMLLALGARRLEAEHQCRYPAPNGQGFPVNQCLDCGGWIIAAPDEPASPEVLRAIREATDGD